MKSNKRRELRGQRREPGRLVSLLFWLLLLTTCLICSVASAAGLFNGTSAYLFTADNLVGSTPTYPVLLGCWVKCADVDTAYVTMSLGDNVSSAYDLMELQCRGDETNNPVFALSGAGGGGTSFGTVDGLTAGSWLFVGAYFETNSSRTVTLITDPAIFTMAVGDDVDVIAVGLPMPLWLGQ